MYDEKYEVFIRCPPDLPIKLVPIKFNCPKQRRANLMGTDLMGTFGQSLNLQKNL